jgi:4-aminobutyrate aminotransferase
MIGVELVVPGGKEPNAAAAGRIMEEAKKDGLLIGKGGLWGNVLRVAPPLTLTQEEAEEGLEIIGRAIEGATG